MAEEKEHSVRLYSYRKVWCVEKKVYAIQNIVLPVPVNPYEILEFILAAFLIMVLGKVFPVLNGIPGVIRYLAFPIFIIKYLMKVKMDGKNPVSFFLGLIPYALAKGSYMERFCSYRGGKQRVKLHWMCSRQC